MDLIAARRDPPPLPALATPELRRQADGDKTGEQLSIDYEARNQWTITAAL